MFSYKKIPTISASKSDTQLLEEFSNSLKKTNLLSNQKINDNLFEIINLGSSLLDERLALKNHSQLYHNFKNIFSTILPNLINSYGALSPQHRETALVKDYKTAQTILLEQLDNLKLILIEIKNTISPEHLKNFLIESTIIEQKSANIENKDALLEQARKEANVAFEIKSENMKKTMKDAQDAFKFFENFDEENAYHGKRNLGIAMILAVITLVSSIAILVF